MRLVVLLLVLVTGQGFAVPHRTVTNEDIRDAILSVVNMIRATEDKLERHEYRERILGDQVKKSLIALEKRIKTLDQGTVSRLDERIATIESMWIQKVDKEKVQMQKTFEAVEDIQKNLPAIVEKLKADVISEIRSKSADAATGDSAIKLGDVENVISKKVSAVEDSIKGLRDDLKGIKAQNDKVQEIHNESKGSLEKINSHLQNNKDLLERYENKLSEYNNKIQIIPQDDNVRDRNIIKILDEQKTNVEQVLTEVKTITSKLNKIDSSGIETNLNLTLDKIESLRSDLDKRDETVAAALFDKTNELKKLAGDQHADNSKSLLDVSEMIESLTDNFAVSYDVLKSEIKNLGKFEQVMVQTADGVLDTKRRVEYGVHQILLEVGDLIKTQTKELNSTINSRFNGFELSILDDETGALANLTVKIGDEIDQVWRQIGIMHQQMSASTDTLNKLQNQTDVYVNGSLNVMDSMKGKVVKITDRMQEVDDNLNYLMGRLSLVTQEFNMIKSGLGKALDEIRASFHEVQEKVTDKGPGPHKIADDNEIETTTKSSTVAN